MSAPEPGPIELRPLCRLTLHLRPPLVIGSGPLGNRLIFEAREGSVEGERLSGTVVGPGADWLTVNGDGVGTLDVRCVIQTHDGAAVYVQYQGRMDTTAGATPTLFIAPRFETGDERYRWLNLVQAVGKGVGNGATVVYDIAEMV